MVKYERRGPNTEDKPLLEQIDVRDHFVGSRGRMETRRKTTDIEEYRRRGQDGKEPEIG